MNKKIVLLFLIILIGCANKDIKMIDFVTGTDKISFGNVNSVINLPKKTVMFWLVVDTLNLDRTIVGSTPTTLLTDERWWVGFSTSVSGAINFQQSWSGGVASWRTGSVITTGNLFHIAVSYDLTSTSNNPVIYINGVSQSLTTAIAPSGTVQSGTNTELRIGYDSNTARNALDGMVGGLVIYNHILTAAEVADAYNSRLAIPNYNGLVFAPNLVGAKGLQTFDGATLSGSNTMIDNISGAVGTPSGDPLGAADTYLTYEG